MVYEHTNSKGTKYYLHGKEGKNKQMLYYFAKDKRSNAIDLPSGFKVIENPKTGLPMLKRG